VNIAALRPYKGYGTLRVSENSGDSKYNSLQISGERRYSNGFKLSVAYTYGKSTDDGSDKRNVLWNSYDDATTGGRRTTTGRTCWSSPTSTTCRSGVTRAR